jgi:Tol biopolymer transport system component
MARQVPARIYSYSADGRVIEPITSDGTASNPSPSPDARQLVLDSGEGTDWSSTRGQWDLWTLRLPDGLRTRLTSTAENDWGPAWSPDGRRIAFASGLNRVYALHLIAPDGAGRRVLTRTDRFPDQP